MLTIRSNCRSTLDSESRTSARPRSTRVGTRGVPTESPCTRDVLTGSSSIVIGVEVLLIGTGTEELDDADVAGTDASAGAGGLALKAGIVSKCLITCNEASMF